MTNPAHERDLLDRLRVVADAAGLACWEFSYLDQRFTWFGGAKSDGLAAMSIEDANGVVLDSTLPEDVVAMRVATETALANGEDTLSSIIRRRHPDGSLRHLRLYQRFFRDPEGKPLRAVGATRDITDEIQTALLLQQQQENLLDAQRRLERAIRGTQDGLWEIDLGTGTMWLSPRLHELLGFADGELSTSDDVLRLRVHPDDLAESDAAVLRNVELGEDIDVEIRMRTKQETYRWFRLRGMAEPGTSGATLRASGSMQDVTAAREARDALIRASQAAQAANVAKSAFLATVSHEIRTPMNGIIGMTSLLLDTSLDMTQRDYAETVRSSSNSLLSVINDILDFSKIEAGRLDIESIDMDLPATVDDVGAMMALQAAAKNIELIIHVDPDVPVRVLADPQRIRQCLINLLGNAIKFTRGGEIVCKVSLVGGAAGRGLTRFEVRDTGIGVAPQTLDTLFQPFVQADSSTTRHFGGTGLGLSIVRRLVEMMGGEAGVESTLGVGSTFWFVLPLTISESQPAQPNANPDRRGSRILVVDDNATNRRVLLAQLTQVGYGVTCAPSTADDLVMLREAADERAPYDVVIADLQMPGMDGEALGMQINADSRISSARVVLLTSMDGHGDLGHFAALGFAGVLSKPVRPRELYACVDRVMQSGSHVWHLQTQPVVTVNAIHQTAVQPGFRGRVLLVEDNVVNQKVARRFLERLGCEVIVAGNGLEGYEAYQRNEVELVLMDVNMPIMDGYEAARRIRAHPGRRVPIVALTANAMMGQLEQCLEAGMDGLLTKPIDVERLEAVLRRAGLSAEPVGVPRGGSDAIAPAVDLVGLRTLTGGDPEFSAELIQIYVDNSLALLNEMRGQVAQGELQSLVRTAHQLKGSSANVHTTSLHQLCAELETRALDLGPADLDGRLAAIAAEFGRVQEALRGFALEWARQG
jgi:signal transduction histidine kinase/DNA-binding response OmpR family regulator